MEIEPITAKQAGLQTIEQNEEPMLRGILYRLGDPIKACSIDRAVGEEDLDELLAKLDETPQVTFHWRSGGEIWVDASEDFVVPIPDRFIEAEEKVQS